MKIIFECMRFFLISIPIFIVVYLSLELYFLIKTIVKNETAKKSNS
jgi:hypothetical protein